MAWMLFWLLASICHFIKQKKKKRRKRKASLSNRAAIIRQENPGLTVIRRGKRYIEFDLGNGRRKHVVTIEPLHYGTSEDQEIDTAWTPTTGAWQYQLLTNKFNLFARNVLNAGDTIQWSDPTSGETCTLQPLALNWVDNVTNSRQQITQPQPVTASVDDCILYWENGYGAGRSFRYTAHPERLIKEIIINSLSNLPTPTVSNPYLELEFVLKASSGVTLYVDGVAWDRSTQTNTVNRIEFRTSGGQVVWLFEKPFADDSAENRIEGIIQLRRSGATRYVTVRFPKSWIDAAQFPITLDPSLVLQPDGTAGIDTQLRENESGTNYGTATVSDLVDNAGARRVILFKFDVSSISGSSVEGAIFSVWNDSTLAADKTVSISKINSANSGWTEGATWDYANGSSIRWAGDTGNDGGVDAGCSVSGTDFDATVLGYIAYTANEPVGTEYIQSITNSAVQEWVDGNNYGFILWNHDFPAIRMSDESNASTRPQLEVVYATEATYNDSLTLSISKSVTDSVIGTLSVDSAFSVRETITLQSALPRSALAYGEQNPTQGETPTSWQTWSDGSSGTPTVVGDSDWGKLQLALSGEEARSAVYDHGSIASRTYTLTENRYGTGSESATLQIRGSTTSFLQDDALPVWVNYTGQVTQSWRYVQVRAITRLSLAMWVWPEDYQTKANADAILSFCTGRVTDIYLMAMDYNASPCVWLGDATLGDVTATRVDGVTPFAYMVSAGNALGINVHAWLWMCDFDFWGSTTGLIVPDVPDNATYNANDSHVWNFHDATARTKLSDVIADFVDQNPGVAGINLDFEATEASITAADMTSFMTELRADAPGIVFSVCTGASISDDNVLKIDMPTWVSSNLIDILTTMGYYDCAEVKRYYIESTGIDKNKVFIGLGVEINSVQPSDFRHKWLLELADGYNNFALFCWASNIKDDVGLRDAVDDWIDGSLVATQSNITKVSITPATSWTITVGGSDQTTSYASVSDHVYSGPLKLHIETAIGSENPAIIYYRLNSATTYILVGDFEP